MLRILAVVLITTFSVCANAQESAFTKTFDAAELLFAGPLGDKSFGSADAPVTVIEYASLTCPHCRKFHLETWPAFKAKYVDTGKVRFIMREFPLDAAASAASMLARCAADERWYAMIDMFYQTQESWAHSDKPLEALSRSVGMAGMDQSDVEACLKDEKMFQGINQVRQRAETRFGVDGTPTFFINGRKEVGALTLDQFAAIIDPLLSSAPR